MSEPLKPETAPRKTPSSPKTRSKSVPRPELNSRPKRKKPATDNTATKQRSRRAGKDPQEKVIVVPQIDPHRPEDAEEILAKVIPEWATLAPVEREEITKLISEYRAIGDPVKVKLVHKEEGGVSIELAGKCETLTLFKLQKAFASSSIDPVNARAGELINYLSSVGACNDGRYNAALSFVESMRPADQAEALLLVQMYVTHDAALRALAHIGKADWVPQIQTFGNLAAKLLRVSQGQMETLARMRRGGEQVIKHIHIDNRGGQAVVTDTVRTGGRNAKKSEQPHAQRAGGPAMLGHDAATNGVPVAGDQREEALQDARGAFPRCA